MLTRSIHCIPTWLPDSYAIFRFTMISELSYSLINIIKTVCDHLSLLAYGHHTFCDYVSVCRFASLSQLWLNVNGSFQDMTCYEKLFPELLSVIAIQRPVVLILDGLDRIEVPNLDWIPQSLPNNAKMIISASTDSNLYNQFKAKFPSEECHKEVHIISYEFNLNYFIILYRYNSIKLCFRFEILVRLKQNHFFCRPLHSTVILSTRKRPSHFCRRCSTALFRYMSKYVWWISVCCRRLGFGFESFDYFQVLAWRASWFTQIDHNFDPKNNLNDEMDSVLDFIDAMLGANRVRIALSLIAVSKYGLRDSELLEMLSHESEFHSDTTYRKLSEVQKL